MYITFLILSICFTERDIKQLTDDKRYGYITYQDIRSVESFRYKTVLVVKAPAETELQVPQDHTEGEVNAKLIYHVPIAYYILYLFICFTVYSKKCI